MWTIDRAVLTTTRSGVNARTVSVASLYSDFAVQEARGVSPSYERLAHAIARDGELLALIEQLPPAKQQPNLLLAVVQLLGGPINDAQAFHDFTIAY